MCGSRSFEHASASRRKRATMVSSRDVVGVQDLERHLAAGRDLLAAEHRAEPALADLVLDEVAVVERAPDQVLERLRSARGSRAARRRAGRPARGGTRARARRGGGRARRRGRRRGRRRWAAERRPRRTGTDGGPWVGTADGGCGANPPEVSAAPAAAATRAGTTADAPRAATAASAVCVIGRPQTPQNRAPSSISLEQCGQRAMGDSTSRESDFAGRVVFALHHEDAARRGGDQREQEQRQQRAPAARLRLPARPPSVPDRRAPPWWGCRPR